MMFHKLFMMYRFFVSPLQGSNEWESVFRGFRCASPTAKFCRPDGAFGRQAYFFAPLLDVETGAGTVGKLVVAVDGGDGVLFHQVMHQLEEGETLGFGAGVGGVAVGIEAADISDANALGVVTWAMGTDLFDGTASVDAAVRVHDIMIADVVPAEALMVAADALHGAVGIGAGGGAMDDDFGDCSHGVFR